MSIAKRLAMVIMIMRVMRETKKYFHLALVVIRTGMMMVIEIVAVASAEGVTQNPIQRMVMAFDACSEASV